MEFFGRLHPILLHLPIGFLLLAYLMEVASRRAAWSNLKPAVGFALNLGSWSAIGAAASGYWLSQEGGYEENLLFWHQWLGIVTAILAVLLSVLFQKKETTPFIQKCYFPIFSLTVLLLFVAGHFGGSLTHGSDFLTAPFTEKNAALPIADLDNAVVFQELIQPIFEKKCIGCHNENKVKGDLLLTTKASILAGGKSGDFLIKGDADNSLFLQRVHLPLAEKKHMPPKGKVQLTEEEIALLTWWVEQGADFEKTVGESEVSNEIQAILDKYQTPKEADVLALNIGFANEKEVETLTSLGFEVRQIAQESPFLNIKWIGGKVDKAILKNLSKVGEQVLILDLSGSNIKDDLLEIAEELPHLQQLFLQKTELTGTGLKYLKQLQYLAYLNLYETKVEDAGLIHLKELKRLKKLFLWQTKVSKSAIADLQKELPYLNINTGTAMEIFGGSQLKPATVVADKELFKDSITIVLEHRFPRVKLHFTLDGTMPDSSSTVYTTPLVLRKAASLKVIAIKAGWDNSEVLTKVFTKIDYEPKSVKLSKSPNPSYAADGATALIDLKKGTTAFAGGNWLGYQGEHFTATIDLGQASKVGRVTISALEDTNSYIFFPKGMQISTSVDGVNFEKRKEVGYPTTSAPDIAILSSFSETFEPITARFIKVKVLSNLKNPNWHPAPSAPCWVFIDEIIVSE